MEHSVAPSPNASPPRHEMSQPDNKLNVINTLNEFIESNELHAFNLVNEFIFQITTLMNIMNLMNLLNLMNLIHFKTSIN